MSAARMLGTTALALAVAAPFAGDPGRSSRTRIDVDEIAGIVAREEDHVDALELARWIRGRKAGLRIIDVRSRAEFEQYALPGAEHLPMAGIAGHDFSDRDVLVLYSTGGAHAAQAWVLLRAMGLREVYFLRGGLEDWIDEVMQPVRIADVTPEQRRAFDEVAELSRYFGGTPGIGGAAPIARPRRRGC